MHKLLKYLIFKMKTVDGEPRSALKLLDFMNRQTENDYMLRKSKTTLSDTVKKEINKQNECILFNKVCLKFKILQIRAKISYMAFVKK